MRSDEVVDAPGKAKQNGGRRGAMAGVAFIDFFLILFLFFSDSSMIVHNVQKCNVC